MPRASFQIDSTTVAPGTRATIDLQLTQQYTHSPVNLPVQVIHGRLAGPVLFVSAAIHGDEINGVEIIRRLLAVRALERLRGTLILIPVVNVFGFLNHSRYLPDRRDLNRSFPGSDHGSLAARLAHLFLTEIVRKSTHGIDLHTAAGHRENLPQVRADLSDPETRELAAAFGAPIVIDSSMRDGSLRETASALGVKTLIYEGGEALRFDEHAIRGGVHGVVTLMRKLGMLRDKTPHPPVAAPVFATNSTWVRAGASGIHSTEVALGARVAKDTELGVIAGPFGENPTPVRSSTAGIVIGRNQLPLVNEGDALFHIAEFDSTQHARQRVEAYQDAIASLEEFERDIRR